jgi:glycosyltransferase involved in cell wall biosynthesis
LKILLTTPPAARAGGVTEYFRALRPHWKSDVVYFTVGSRTEAEPAAAVAFRIVRDTWRFFRLLRRGGFDLVHLNPSLGPKAAVRDGLLLGASAVLGRRPVILLHGWDRDFEARLRSRYAWLFRFAINRAAACAVLGSDFAERLRDLGYGGRIFVLRAPVDDALLARASGPERGGPAFTILFLARIEKNKGIYEALETYRILKSRHSALRLLVAGDGPDLENARRVAPDGVTFAGHIEGDAKSAAFNMACAYLFPSYHEGLPISVLEAMSHGLPVVTTRVGGLPDFFVDGRMGYMAPSPDPEQLAVLMERIIGDPAGAARMRRFNRQYARENFTGARIAASVEDIYATVLAGAD